MPFLDPAAVRTVACFGAGTIGASWTAWFLARGLHVRASDPEASREAFVRATVTTVWPALRRLGAAAEEAPERALARLSFEADPARAVEGADFVQENAPEREELKRDLLARIDAALPPDRVIASSTSGFGVSALGRGMNHPERLVIGHPFNPPHLIPLVEVVGGSPAHEPAVQWTLSFYRWAGKRPIHIRKEVPGHLANRLQAALWREAVHLVAEGVASVADVDAAIAYGPGLRWALIGPHLTFHLGGGEGGMAHFVDHLGPPIERWWADLGSPRLTPDVRAKLIEGVDEEISGRSFGDLVAERDERLLRLQEALAGRRSPDDPAGAT